MASKVVNANLKQLTRNLADGKDGMLSIWPSLFTSMQGTRVRRERTQKVARTAFLSYTAPGSDHA